MTAPERPLAGIAVMIAAMILVPQLDVCAKLLSAQGMPVLQVTWARFFFHFIALAPLVSLRGYKWWKPPSGLGGHLARGAFIALAAIFFFAAIADNPIPDSLALLFVAPLIVAASAPFLLGEAFDPRRAAAAVVGFSGVLVVLRPFGESFAPTLLFALAAGVCYAAYIMAARRAAAKTPPLLTVFYTSVFGLVFLSAPAFANWVWPDARAWGLMMLMGIFAAAGHYCITKACELARASVVAPFNYMEMIAAVITSWLIFDHFPDARTWLGIAIITASGIYISATQWRRRPPAPVSVDL